MSIQTAMAADTTTMATTAATTAAATPQRAIHDHNTNHKSSTLIRKDAFWDDATKHAASSNDDTFVDEIAYIMVTLHRTGTT